MTKKIPIGVDDFARLVSKEHDYLFVDKSLFIKEILDDGTAVSLIIRPRRWGKTLNMSMLQYFFAPMVKGRSTQGLFDHLAIASEADGSYMKHQGSHPVILISFKGVKEGSFEDFLSNVSGLMAELYREHHAILTTSPKLSEFQKAIFLGIISRRADKFDLQNALKFLSECLEDHYNKKVIILIDEYDTPLNIAYNKDYFEDATGFFKNLLGAALKGNSSLEKGILTGILRLSKNNMLSDLNNLKLYSIMENQYSRHFGFSETEVKQLFVESGVYLDLPTVQRWYNGYCSGDLLDIYNPWSILNCIDNKGALKDYWIRTGDEGLLRTVFIESKSEIKEKLLCLINGNSIESSINDYVSFDQIKEGREEVLWSLLWTLGYLKIVDHHALSSRPFKKHHLKIPNYEVATSYRDVFISFINNLKDSTRYQHCLEYLIKGNVEAFVLGLQHFMLSNVSYFDCSSESNYHMLLLGMSSYLRETHDVLSNREVGLGRPDLVLIPIDTHNPIGIVLEFKRAETGKTQDYYQQLANQGLDQINKNHYDVQLKSKTHVRQILKLCMVFYGKDFAYNFVMETIA